jgi:hypothetical protein
MFTKRSHLTANSSPGVSGTERAGRSRIFLGMRLTLTSWLKLTWRGESERLLDCSEWMEGVLLTCKKEGEISN